MDGKTIRLLSEYIAELHKKDRERNANSGYNKIYDSAEMDTNGVEQDWKDDRKD